MDECLLEEVVPYRQFTTQEIDLLATMAGMEVSFTHCRWQGVQGSFAGVMLPANMHTGSIQRMHCMLCGKTLTHAMCGLQF